VVTTMLSGDGVQAKLYSTDADSVLTPPFKRGVMRVQEMYSPGKASAETSPTATGKADRETRPSK
jgi:hypothetical protein